MKILTSGIATLFVLLLMSCGENYCIMGLAGNCQDMYKNGQSQSGVGSGGAISVTAQQGFVVMTKTLQLTVSGGTGKVTMVSTDLPNCGSLDSNYLFTPIFAGKCVLHFRDSATPVPQDGTFPVEIRNLNN